MNNHPYELPIKKCCCKEFHETDYLEYSLYDDQWILHWEGYDDSIGPDEPIKFCPFCGSRITIRKEESNNG